MKSIEIVEEWLREFVPSRDVTLRTLRLKEYDSVVEIDIFSNLSNLCNEINKGSFFKRLNIFCSGIKLNYFTNEIGTRWINVPIILPASNGLKELLTGTISD